MHPDGGEVLACHPWICPSCVLLSFSLGLGVTVGGHLETLGVRELKGEMDAEPWGGFMRGGIEGQRKPHGAFTVRETSRTLL